jgi:hypothetical protein
MKLAVVLSLVALGAAAAVEAPGFRCTGPINATERLICEDAELAAFDRAVTLLFRGALPFRGPGAAGQRLFLRKRNACGADRGCVLSAYRGWLDDYGWGILYSIDHRYYTRGLEAPAVLHVLPLGNDWYLFSSGASNSYTSATRPASYAGGVIRLSDGTGRFVERRRTTLCAMDLSRRSERDWRIRDNGGCGVLPMTGTYRPYDW